MGDGSGKYMMKSDGFYCLDVNGAGSNQAEIHYFQNYETRLTIDIAPMLEIGPTCPFALQAQPSTSIWAQMAPSEEKERGAPKNSDAEEAPEVPPQAAACPRGFALCPCAPYSKPFVLCKQLLACAGNDSRTRNQVR